MKGLLMDSICLKAYAKINLGLDVIGRRPNGYHDVRMIMQTIDLFDTLHITKNDSGRLTLSIDRADLPADQNNLIYRAAKLLIDEFHITDGIHIDLKKSIPIAAGMAGGSTDAAATFVGLNQLFDLDLSKKQLMERGVTLGADIPYCIMQGTALSEGIGEILTPIDPMPDCSILIAKPPIGVSTKYVYEHLQLDSSTEHPKIDALIHEIHEQNVHGVAANLGNILESVTLTKYPIIESLKKQMLEHGALGALMSGSGPTVFGIYDDPDTASKALNALQTTGLANDIFLTRCYNH